MDLDASIAKIHRMVQLCAVETDRQKDQKSTNKRVDKLDQGQKVKIYRPLSAEANAKVGWIEGYSVLESNEFSAKLKNEKNGTTDWVHRDHIIPVHVRPSHLEDDSDDETEFEPVIHNLRVDIKEEPSESSSRGVKTSTSSTQSVADESLNSSNSSSSSRRSMTTEREMADFFKDVLKTKNLQRRDSLKKPTKKRKKSPSQPTRRSTRERKEPDKLEMVSHKQSYVKPTSPQKKIQ